jgi:PAS domain S-box-containing protein
MMQDHPRPDPSSADAPKDSSTQRFGDEASVDPAGGEPDFRSLVEDASLAIVVVSLEGTILYFNRAACGQTGFTAEELQQRPVTTLLPPDEAVRVMAIRAARRAGLPAPRRYETVLLLRDGNEMPVEVSVIPVRWMGQPADAVFMRDLSAQRKADRALHESEERWRAVASVLPDQVFLLDEDGRYVEAMGAQEELLQVPVDTLKGRLMQEVLPADVAQAFLQVVGRTIEEGTTQSLEYSQQLKSGEVWFEGRSALLRNTIDGKRCVVWIARDITERKQAERVREHQHQFMRDLLDAIPNPVFVKDHEHRFLVLNDALCSFVGRERGELLGKSDFDFFPEEEARWFVEKDSEVLSSRRPNEVEENLTTASGERRWILTRKTAGTGPDGKPILIGSFSDLTERRRAEEQLHRRDRILEAMNLAAGHLLGSKAWTECIDEILATLGQATGVSRIQFYQAIPGPEREVHARPLAWWVDPAQQLPPGPEEWAAVGSSGIGVSTGLESFRRGQVLYQPIQAYPEPIRGRLRALGALSVVGVPVLAGEEWWGCFVLVDCTVEREWAPGELEALRLSGSILGAAIQRQKVAEALEESEEKYRTLVEGADQPIVILDGSGRFHFANGTAVSELGLSAGEVLGRTVRDSYPPEYADLLMEGVSTAISSGTPTIRQARSLVRGRDYWIEGRIQPLRESDGSHRRALVILTDVTQRKEAEDRILAYQEQLRSLTSELALTEQRERKRLASELHDHIGQSLAVSKIKLGALRESATRGAEIETIEEVWKLIDQTIQDTRTLTFQLSPPILHELGLEPALEWLVETFGARHGIDATFTADGRVKPLGSDLSGLLFQSVQELLINAAKHGHPSRVKVSSRRMEERIMLEVQDDGSGFELSQIGSTVQHPRGFGLFSIRERLGILGGSMEVRSRPGHGTSVLLSALLLDQEPDADGGGTVR